MWDVLGLEIRTHVLDLVFRTCLLHLEIRTHVFDLVFRRCLLDFEYRTCKNVYTTYNNL